MLAKGKVDVEEYVSELSVMRVIDRYVNCLNLVTLCFKHSVFHNRGRPPCAPDNVLKL